MNLYDINKQIEDAYMACINEETGEFDEQAYKQTIEMLNLTRQQKIENIICYIKNLKADAEALRAEEKNLAERRKSCESKAEHLSNYLQDYLAGEKFECAKGKVSYRKSKVVDIYDEEKATDALVKHDLDNQCLEHTIKIKKAEVKKALAGLSEEELADFDGLKIVENVSMSIK